jgi:sarcosine oxidase subunit alpha
MAERWPPWLYETRFLHPRALRQLYLAALRRLSAAPPLPAGAPPCTPRPARDAECRTLVVGGGLAGLAAAAVVAAAGRDVAVVEAEEPGGVSRWLPRLRQRARDLIGSVQSAGGRGLRRTLCVGIYPEEGVAGLVGPDGPVAMRYEDLIVATGAYDRPLHYPGNDLPGTLGVRGFEALAAQGAVPAGTRVGVYGATAEAGRAIATARDLGVKVAWVAGPGDVDGPAALPRARLRCAGGRRRVRWVEVDEGRRLGCDLFVLGFSQPSWELAAQAGMALEIRGDPPVVAPVGEGPLVVGEAAGWVDPGEAADQAGAAARAWLAGQSPTGPPATTSGGAVGDAHEEAFVCFCEDVRVRDIRRAVAEGFDHPELVKRRTGALTGPCQGRLCLAGFAALLRDLGVPADVPTVRPPARPVTIAALGGTAGG